MITSVPSSVKRAMWAVLVLLAPFAAIPAYANTYTVTNLNDSGTGSLRAAIASATSSNSNDTIVFTSGLTGTITLTTSTLAITTSLNINGPGASSIAVSGGNSLEVFSVGGGITVTISGLTVQNGNNASGTGGGIANSGTLNVTNCAIHDNSAAAGGGIYSTGTLTVTDSNVSGNSATGSGAGISIGYPGTLNVTNSTVWGNSSGGDGAGIFNVGTTVTLTGSTVSGNVFSSQYGGGGAGIFNAGNLTVTNSTISGNSAGLTPFASGGGIYNNGGTLTITNSTIAGNLANVAGQGGGIYSSNVGTNTVTSSTLWANIAGSSGGGNVFSGGSPAMIFKNSIVGFSFGSGANCSGQIASQGYNLSDDTTCGFTQTTDITGYALPLGTASIPQNNGGPTRTIALFSSSPAVGKIPASNCSATDQRGVARPQVGVTCDIGAYELQNLQTLAWGNDPDGELGNGTTTTSGYPTPAPVLGPGGAGTALSGVVATAAGGQVSFALTSDGKVWAWGDNTYGELGNGTLVPVNSATPTQVMGLPTDIIAIAAGSSHGLALESNGAVWAWGRNNFGQLGNGTFSNSATPVHVTGGPLPANVLAIAAGSNHSMALAGTEVGSSVWTWGYNNYGGLGNGTATTASPFGIATPALVAANSPGGVACTGGAGSLAGVVAIAGGASQSLALEYNGTVMAWGFNSDGELGNGTTTTDVCAPIQVLGPGGISGPALANVKVIASGVSQSMALTGDGSVWDWGYGISGQLGNNNANNASSDTPVQVVGSGGTGFLSGITAISGGNSYSSALKSDTTVWTWGNNFYGSLGSGTTTTTGCNCLNTPAQVVGLNDIGDLTGVTAISAGGFFSLALAPVATTPPYAQYSSPGPINFGSVIVGSSGTQQFTLTDTGSSAFTLSGFSFTPTGSAFVITNIVCNGISAFPFPAGGVTLAPASSSGDMCTITLQFVPQAAGSGQTVALVINTSTTNSNAAAGPGGAGQAILLVGTGLATTATTTTVTSTSSSFMGFPLPSNYALVGNPVTVNFSVQPVAPSMLVPTGTVIVEDGAQEFCTPTGILTSGEGGKGSCPLSILGLGNGSTTLYAQYTPDAASLSAGLLGSNTAQPLFTENLVQIINCGPLPQPQSAPPGQVAVFAFSVCLAGDVNAAVTATCAQLAGTPLSCSPPPTVTEMGNTGVYAVSVTVSAATGLPGQDRWPWRPRWPLALIGVGMLLTMLMARYLAWKHGRRPRLLYAAGSLFVLALLLGNINGCGSPSNAGGGGGGTPPGQYIMNVKVSAGAFSVTVPVTLNVT